MGRRFQARRGNGRFTRNTPENTLGLSIEVCPFCRALNPRPAGTPRADNCHACGRSLDGCSRCDSSGWLESYGDRWRCDCNPEPADD